MEHLPMRKKITIFLATMSAMFFSSINQTIVGTSLPHITEELGGQSYFNWVFTIYMLASSLTAVLVGKLSDMYGCRLFLLLGIGVFLTGSFLNGTADSMLQLIAYRGIQGAGGGMVISTAFASIADLFVPRERARWQGYMSLSFGTASLFGPTLGGYIVEHFDWHWVFWMFLPFGVVAFTLIWLIYPAPVTRNNQTIDTKGCLLLALNLIGLMLAFTLAQSNPLPAAILFLAVVPLFIWFIKVERKAVNPVIPLQLFENQVYTISCMLNFIFGFSMFVNAMYTPLFMQSVLGFSPSLSGLIWLSFTMSMMASSTLSGQWMTKRGTYKRTSMIGFMLLSAAMLLLTQLGTGVPHVLLAMTLVLLGAGIGINFPVFTVTAQNAVGYSRIGAATSSSQLFRQTGGTVGVSLMGFVLGTEIGSAGEAVQGAMQTGLHAVFWSISLLALGAVFIVIYYFKEIPLLSENTG